jgi:microcystin-dependent protein
MSAKLDWLDIQAVSLPETNIIALTHVGAILILACNAYYRERYNWRYGDDDITDNQWDDIGHCIGLMEHEIMSGLIGAILPHFMADISGLNMLACDGSIYNRVDYPLLYEAIDSSLHIDADTFSVPDLRDKFPMSEGMDFAAGDTGGEREHTLTGLEMPEHTHDNAPHAHTEIIAVSSVGAAITGVPVPSAIAAGGLTSFESISINPAGESNPHNNMPPFIALKWAIVAG